MTWFENGLVTRNVATLDPGEVVEIRVIGGIRRGAWLQFRLDDHEIVAAVGRVHPISQPGGRGWGSDQGLTPVWSAGSDLESPPAPLKNRDLTPGLQPRGQISIL